MFKKLVYKMLTLETVSISHIASNEPSDLNFIYLDYCYFYQGIALQSLVFQESLKSLEVFSFAFVKFSGNSFLTFKINLKGNFILF